MKKRRKSLSYAKWGYLFILPFFITYFIFSLIPMIDTVRYSFFEYYRSGIKEIGPNFIGLENYISLLHSDMVKYGENTLILWLIGFIPQIVIALILAAWFTRLGMTEGSKITGVNVLSRSSTLAPVVRGSVLGSSDLTASVKNSCENSGTNLSQP